ncbi:hypothetical protein BSY16_4333 (plasmid) [Sinorhizobium sp. RAC02]|nr:hypothetical protein BSY16_4333 [Sinorhizobium sp. RAC02]
MNAALFQIFDDFKQMADRSCQPVETYDDESVAEGKVFEKLSQHRSCAGCAGFVLLQDTVAASRPQFVDLRIVERIVR